jgi:hypothetical protein
MTVRFPIISSHLSPNPLTYLQGPATYASPFLSSQRGNPNVSPDAHTSRPTTKSASKSKPNNKNFNTSRTLKAVNDSSPMDFAYLPSASILAPSDVEVSAMQIPILPETDSKVAMGRVEGEVALPAAMKPEISSVVSRFPNQKISFLFVHVH